MAQSDETLETTELAELNTNAPLNTKVASHSDEPLDDSKTDERLKSEASEVDTLDATLPSPAGNNADFEEELSSFQKLRKFVRLSIVKTAWFEYVILVVILINCVFLALENPTKNSDTTKDVIEITEVVFTVIYIIEMLLKWVALGFVGRHHPAETAHDKTADQKASVFSYMVNSVFNGEEEKAPTDEWDGYFLDGWNVLDFIIVIFGSIVPLAVPGTSSVGSIRALRILRALRTIPRVPKLRTLVMTIIDAIPGLTGAMVLLSFFFIVFGIIGIELFVGQLNQQCTSTLDNSPLSYTAVDTEYIALCAYSPDNPGGEVRFGGSYQSCNDVAIALGHLPTYACTSGNENPLANMQRYDNIFYALLQVFQTVTLHDWSDQLYNLARSGGYVYALYFVPLTFFVSFFAINLILAVIVDTYSRSIRVVQTEEDDESQLREMDELITAKTMSKRPVKQRITYETYPRKMRALREKVQTFEELFKEYNQGPVERASKTHELQRRTKLRVDTTRGDGNSKEDGGRGGIPLGLAALAEEVEMESKADLGIEDDLANETWDFTKRADEQKKLRRQMISDLMLNFNKDLAFEVWVLAKPIHDDWLDGAPIDETQSVDTRRFWQKKKPTWVRWLYWFSTSEWFEKAIIFIILLNTIILSIHYPQMPAGLESGLRYLNVSFTIIFALELLIKIVGLGPRRWWFDKFNVFDAVIVVLSIVELCLPGESGGGGALLAFRALRVLRVMRLLHQIPRLRTLFDSILNSFEPVVFLVLIILLFVFMFGVLGVQLWAGKIYPSLRQDVNGELSGFLLMTRPWRFDTLWYSMVTFLQLFTGDGWPSVMEDVVRGSGGEASALVVIMAVVVGLWLFRNMFLAILINRMGSQDNIQLMIGDLLRMAREKQRIMVQEKEMIKAFEKDVREVRKKHMGRQTGLKHQKLLDKKEQLRRITGKSLMFLRPDHVARLALHKLQASDAFEWSINALILVNCVALALHGPHVTKDTQPELYDALRAADIVFTIIFLMEMCLKMTALGVYCSPLFGKAAIEDADSPEARKNPPRLRSPALKMTEEEVAEEAASMACTNAYLSTWWNRLDALVVFFAVLGLFFPEVGVMRGLRAIRPIRVAIRIPRVRVVVKALLNALPNVANAFCFSLFILIVLGIVGLQLFSGQFGRCVNPGNAFDVVYPSLTDALEVADKDSCEASGFDFINPGYDFDHIFISLLTVFKISMFSNWYDELAGGMASNGDVNQSPSAATAIPYNRPVAAAFFVLVVLIAGFFVLNIIISVVVDSFNRIKNEDEQNALLTPKQVYNVRKRRFLNRFPLRDGHKPPHAESQAWRLPFFRLVERPAFEYFIIACILLNTLFLMTQHYGEPEAWKDVQLALEIAFVVIYALEATLKLIAYAPKGYFGDWWNVFDFVIVLVSLVGFAVSEADGLNVIRLLRVLRVVRLVKKAPLLRALFMTLTYALPSLVNIGLLLLVIFFIFAIFGVELFGKVVHSDGYGNPILYDSNEGLSASINFEDFGHAMLVLYRTATNDNWGSILLSAGAQDEDCGQALLDGVSAPRDGAFDYECGNLALATVYFVLFTLLGTFVMVNLFIAVILDTYTDNVQFEHKMLQLELLNAWKAQWRAEQEKVNPGKIKPRLPVKAFVRTLQNCPLLVGRLLLALNLRLNIEETDTEIDYNDTMELQRRSTETYGKLDFVGRPNALDADVKVSNDHLYAIFKTRRLRILCSYRGANTFNDKLVVSYSDALFSIASLLVGPEFRLLPYDNNQRVHIADWWQERMIGNGVRL